MSSDQATEPASVATDDGQMKDIKRLILYVPALTTAPFLWGCKCLITIFFGSIVTNVFDTYCNYPLDSFVSGQVALAYTFLMIWGWILIGPLPFKSLKTVFILYGLLALIQFIWAIIGTAWYNLGRLACRELVPELTAYANFEIVTFWVAFVVAAFYIIRWQVEVYQEKKKNAFLSASISSNDKDSGEVDDDYDGHGVSKDETLEEYDDGDDHTLGGSGQEAAEGNEGVSKKSDSNSDEEEDDDDDDDPF